MTVWGSVMIPSCPQDFWDNVAKRVAQAIMDREQNLAGVNPTNKPVVVEPPGWSGKVTGAPKPA